MIREICDAHGIVAHVYDFTKASSTFFPSPPEFNLQIGFHVNGAEKTYRPHVHLPVERSTQGTAEYIHVLAGEVRVSFLDDNGRPIGRAVLKAGMAMLQLRGGHAIETDADTHFVEVKQGPYEGQVADKWFVD